MGEGVLSDDGECCVIEETTRKANFDYEEIRNLLMHAIVLEDATSKQRRAIRRKNLPYTMIGNVLYYSCRDEILHRAVEQDEAQVILNKCHEGVC